MENIKEIIVDLQSAFHKSIINNSFEFVADPNPRVNTYFRLEDVNTLLDAKCKVIAYLSRAAFKTEPYRVNFLNQRVHDYHLGGINDFLGTDFTERDMELIYTRLGNDINRSLCEKFIKSGYDMSVLE